MLEFGGRNIIDPNERHEAVLDIADRASKLTYPATTMTVSGEIIVPHAYNSRISH